jgi:indole-3-glycerol phosphate synthase
MILDDIAASTRIRVDAGKKALSTDDMAALAAAVPSCPALSFETALANDGKRTPSFICEVKKASPSKGLIASGPEGFPYLKIAKEYEEAGAAAISVLTEPDYFLGSNAYLKEIAAAVQAPVLRKDFIIDEYQIYQTRILGASAVLLICAMFAAIVPSMSRTASV